MIRYIDELTELQKKVDARHAEWEKRQLVSKPATSGPPTQPAPAKPNAILSPTMSSTRFSTTNSNMPENQPFGSSKFPNQTVNNATFGSRNSVPSPPHTQLAQQQQQSLPPANDLAARLKALGPASSAGSNNTAPPPPRVLPKQSSSFLDSSSPAGLKPSPSSSSLKSLPPQPPQPAVPLKRESSNGPTSVPPLSRSPSSGSGLGTVGPGTGAGRVIQNRTMSAGDLYLGLAGQEKDNTTKVLVVDVRPMEEYVQGHVRWPDEKRKASAVGAGEVSSGLVHLEPDWIHPGVETDHIVHCLRGFTTHKRARQSHAHRPRQRSLCGGPRAAPGIPTHSARGRI
ncbi:hypothetical protein BC830DRAFT_874091 [Chytriomyces sp. MP71]|nr:hypothetical protein BC830DRAFT_874091 [Chytriomyces sp. MP71]